MGNVALQFQEELSKDSREKGFLSGQNVMDREFVLFNLVGLLHVVLFFLYAKNVPAWVYVLPIVSFLVLLGVTWNSRRKLIAEGREGESLKNYRLEQKLNGEVKQITEKPTESVPLDNAAQNKSLEGTRG